MDKTTLKRIVINDNLTIKNAIKILNNTALQILLVTNTKNRNKNKSSNKPLT